MKIYKTQLSNKYCNISLAVTVPQKNAVVRKEYLENTLLNIYSHKMGNPVVEKLMDKVIDSRSIPIDDGIATLNAIKEKYPYLSDYINYWLNALKRYKNMI